MVQACRSSTQHLSAKTLTPLTALSLNSTARYIYREADSHSEASRERRGMSIGSVMPGARGRAVHDVTGLDSFLCDGCTFGDVR